MKVSNIWKARFVITLESDTPIDEFNNEATGRKLSIIQNTPTTRGRK